MEAFQILVGSLLGDGGICYYRKNNSLSYMEEHSIKQKDYLLWKKDYFNELMSCNIYYRRKLIKAMNKSYDLIYIKGHNIKLLRKLRKLFYKNGVKKITPELLSIVDAQSIAILYMDDGHLEKNGCIEISTNSFSYKENLLLSKHMGKLFNIEVKIHSKSNRKYWRLRLNRENANSFLDKIKAFICNDCEDIVKKIWMRIYICGG